MTTTRTESPSGYPGAHRLACAAMLACAVLACLAGGACTTPDEYRQEVDDEVYAILAERREEWISEQPFSIDPAADTLRQRILAGEVLEPLDLEDLLLVAAENSREYRDRREALFLAALDLTLERWAFSVQESGVLAAFSEGTGGDGEADGLLTDIGFSKLFTSGLELVAGLGLDVVRGAAGGSGWDVVSRASLSVTQPLLRGFGSEIVREPLTQAERDVLYEARDYERFRRTFAFDVTSRFFGVLQQMDTLENQREDHQRRILLLERNENFAEAGRLDEIQVGQARQDELRARNGVIDAERDLQTQLDDFKLFLGLPIDAPLPLDAGAYLEPDSWSFLEIEPREDAVLAIALAMRLDHLTRLERVEDAERRVLVARDALSAGLDVIAGVASTSPLDEPGSHSWDKTGWSIDLVADLPFDRTPERNAYRRALIDVQAALRSAEESKDSIVADLRDDVRGLQAARESWGIQQHAVELAARRVESSELNLDAGRASTRDVLESQDALLQARNAATSALTQYVLSGLSLYLDMELLHVTADGFTVDTGPLVRRLEAEDDPDGA